MTSEAAKQKAQEIADRLAEEDGVENAVVDDYGRHSNFQIALALPHGEARRGHYHIPTSFHSLTPRIKSAVDEFPDTWIDYTAGGINHPSMQYEHCRFTGNNQLGYDRTYTLVHLRINL